jgi:hypothetical protein
MCSVVSLHNALASNSLFASILWSHSLRPGDSELALLTTPNSHHFQIPLNCTFSERLRPSGRALSALRSMRQSVLSTSISAFRTPWSTRKRVNPRRFACHQLGLELHRPPLLPLRVSAPYPRLGLRARVPRRQQDLTQALGEMLCRSISEGVG